MSQGPEYTLSEKPALDLFQSMGYTYLNAAQNDPREGINQVILPDRLEAALKRINPWINSVNLLKAIEKITRVQGSSLLEINQEIWELIRGSTLTLKQTIDGIEGFHEVAYMDYQHPENNDYLVVNQMKFQGKGRNSIPDIVVFLNGLPVVVIECKSPNISNPFYSTVEELNYYQENSEKLFWYNQFCVGLWKDGARYGAIEAQHKFYSVYKQRPEEAVEGIATEQDILLYNLFRKERLLDLIRNFVLFEQDDNKLIKKLPRHQQIRATNYTLARLKQGRGGVVWHTQGSGKSLTMAYVCRKLRDDLLGFENPTILILTDRKDLDGQIFNTLVNCHFKEVTQAHSVTGLESRLTNDYGGIITSTLQKFQESDREATQQEDQTELEEKDNIRIEKKIKGRTLTRITRR